MKAFDLEADIKIDIANASVALDTLIKKAKNLNSELNSTPSVVRLNTGSGGTNDNGEGNGEKEGSFSSTLSVTLGNLSSQAIRAIGDAIKGAIKDGFDYNIERDSYIASLQTIMNSSKEEAEALFNDLAKISLNTPLNQSSIGYASERLLNFGFPREGLEEMIIDLGNLSRGDNEKMERITKALSDTLSKRFLQAQERNQFADAGVDIWGLLDAYYSSTDKDWASLTDEEKSDEFIYRQKNKLLPAADVVAAIQYASDTPGMPYYNAMKLVMDTPGGAAERKKESREQYFATALEEGGFMEDYKNISTGLANYYEKRTEYIKKNGIFGFEGYKKYLQDKYDANGYIGSLFATWFDFLSSETGDFEKNEFTTDTYVEELLNRAIDDGRITTDFLHQLNLSPEDWNRYSASGDLYSLIAPHADEVFDLLGISDEDVSMNISEAIDQIPGKVQEGFSGASVNVTVSTGNVVLDSGAMAGAITPKVNVTLGRLLTNS